uniref:Disease resistance R13L4/SHOC-2-like LRR domain-containing protein n=1 Tax=Setaria italica TaxID=4555 RepID=K3ZMC5_SETIT
MSFEMPLAGICLSSAWAESHVQGDTGEWDTLVSHLLGGFLSIPSMKPLVQSLCLYSDDLPLHLRTCLLYCGVFPPDYPIRMECLEVAEAYIDLLVSRNLLQPVYEESTYRVHLLMLGFLVCKAKEDNFVACRQWTYIGELPMEICKPQHLRILDACKANVRKLPSEIWKLQRLEILDASRTRVTELPTEVTELPTKITKLELLKSLDVSWTGVRELHKEVWKLQHLRSLNISSTKVTELPTEITKLELLKDLDVSWTGVRELPKEIRKLQHFSTLDVRGTKVRELHWEIPNSLSVLVGDKISSEVVMLPQAVSADWVISSSGAERRDDLSIFVLMSNSGWSNEPLQLSLLRVDGRHKKVPQWVKQDLCKVCTLDIRLCKLALQLRFEVLPREPVAITGEGFLKLETFYVDCRLPRVITFKREAMPKLKHLEFKFYTGTASQDHYMGIEHLDSLEKVVFRCSEYYTSDGPGIRETIDVLRKEAVEHPNKITLWVNEHSLVKIWAAPRQLSFLAHEEGSTHTTGGPKINWADTPATVTPATTVIHFVFGQIYF